MHSNKNVEKFLIYKLKASIHCMRVPSCIYILNFILFCAFKKIAFSHFIENLQ